RSQRRHHGSGTALGCLSHILARATAPADDQYCARRRTASPIGRRPGPPDTGAGPAGGAPAMPAFVHRPTQGTFAAVPPTPKEQLVEITGFFWAIIIGLIIGALGRLVLPGRQNIPIWLTILIGIAAALLGTVVAGLFGVDDTRGIDWIELIIQVAFAAAGVAIVAGMRGRRRVS
ncbi:MAG TPA: hypothetical protein VFG96_04115, partial [Jiangellaceae bacterium]|nr:hypothetical protein [Jiangellaceae bacterium]